MSPKHILVIATVSGIIFVVLVYNTISEELAVILAFLATVIIVAGLVIERAYHRPDRFVEQLGEADILNRMWFPLQDELTDVVRTGGRITETSSAWTTAPRLSKKETPGTFFREMEQYVRQRELVASLAASDLATEDSRQQLEAGQQGLLFMAQELHKEVNKAIEAIPGASAVRRTRSARPRPSYQRPQATATRPSPASRAGTRQSTPVSRSAQAQTATPARTIQERPAPARPAPAPMRIADTARTPDRTSPTPIRWEPEPPKAPSAPPPPSRPAPTPLRSHGCTHADGASRYSRPLLVSRNRSPHLAYLWYLPLLLLLLLPCRSPSSATLRSKRAGACRAAERTTRRPATRRGVGVRGAVRSQSDEL